MSTGVIRRLSFDRLESSEFSKAVGRGLNEGDHAGLRKNQEHFLVGQQQDLAVAVSAALPLALSIGQVDAGEKAAVEAVLVGFVQDTIVEIGL